MGENAHGSTETKFKPQTLTHESRCSVQGDRARAIVLVVVGSLLVTSLGLGSVTDPVSGIKAQSDGPRHLMSSSGHTKSYQGN